jgi:hypothetical protein
VQAVEIVAVVVAVLVVSGSVAFGLRLSSTSTAALRERVAETNAVLRALATRLGLVFTEQAPYRHPLMGDIPCYAAAAGTYRGHAVQIKVENDDDAAPIVVTVAADAARPWPNLGRLNAGDGRHPPLSAALAELDPRVSEVRATPTALHVVPKTPKDRPCDAGDLAATVDAAVALAVALNGM